MAVLTDKEKAAKAKAKAAELKAKEKAKAAAAKEKEKAAALKAKERAAAAKLKAKAAAEKQKAKDAAAKEKAKAAAAKEKLKAKAAAAKAKDGVHSRAPKFGETAIITVVAKENPKRNRGDARAKWDLYKSGMTVAEFLAAGGSRTDLTRDAERGWIKVK